MPPESVVIRPATRADLSVLQPFAVQTWRAAFAHTYKDPSEPEDYVAQELSAARFAAALREDSILLAVSNADAGSEQLWGFLQIGPAQFEDLPTDAGDVDLRRLYVAAQQQGQGVGHALLDAALGLACVRRAGRVYLDVWEHNTGAQKLYREYGFAVIAKRRYVTRSGEPGDLDYQMCRVQSRQQTLAKG